MAEITIGTAIKAIFASPIVSALKGIGTALVIQAGINKLFPQELQKSTGFEPRDVTVNSTLEYRKIVYGTARIGGPINYKNVGGVGNVNDDLVFVAPFVHGQSNAILGFYLDDLYVDATDINWNPATATGTTRVDTPELTVSSPTEYAVRISWYLGTSTQLVDGNLDSLFTDVTSTFRGREITYAVLRMRINERLEELVESFPPRDFLAVVEGRLLYDPRLDSTNGGSGSHRFADPTTWAFSANPALAAADYLTQIMGVASTRINWASVRAAADDCDVQVVIPPAASPANTEARFTCNGALSLGDTHGVNLRRIAASMAGRISQQSGVWTVRASVWEASSTTLTQDDYLPKFSVRGGLPEGSRANLIRGVFYDPERDYLPVEFPHVQPAEFLTRDQNKTIPVDVDLPMTNSQYMAQRIALRLLEEADAQVVFECTVNRIGANITAGDVVSVSNTRFGWNAKTFRVVGWEPVGLDRFRLTLREDSAARYVDPLVTEYNSVGSSNLTQPPTIVPPCTNLTASPTATGISLAWSNPASRLFEFIDVYESADNTWANRVLVASVRTNRLDISYPDIVTRGFWVQARDIEGNVSTRLPDADTTTIVETSGQSGGGSAAMNVGRRMNSLEQWYGNNAQSVAVDAGWSVDPASTGPVFSTHMEITDNDDASESLFSERLTIDSDKKYRVQVWARQPSGNRRHSLFVEFYNSSGNAIVASTGGATGWTALGDQHIWEVSLATFPATWTLYQFEFGGNATPTIPSGAVAMAIGGLFVRTASSPATSTTIELQDFNVIELPTDAVVDAPVLAEAADDDIDYTAGTQPRVENAGLNSSVDYTPSGRDAQVMCNWHLQAQISNTTSGVAVGEALARIRVTVDGVEQLAKTIILEGFVDSFGSWATLAGSRTFNVPDGDEIEATLAVYRDFSTSGASPAQTISWRESLVELVPFVAP